MNGELQVLPKEKAAFSLKIDKIPEVKATEITEVRIAEVKIRVSESRFARLKKSLRKRSAGIL
jgi:FKBP-type peptidyl-prolyl cis-trans isomerase (trigger factor)